MKGWKTATTLAAVFLLFSPWLGFSHAQQMVFPGAEWETATPESQGVDSSQLQSAVNFLDASMSAGGGVDELVIIRNGRMIWEGPESDNVHLVWSTTKSFATTALGLLIDDGLVTIDSLAQDFVPSMAADYPDVTLRHLATHTSGYRAEEEPYPYDFDYAPVDPFTPGPPLFEPGSRFSYSPYTGMDQMMNILTRAAGEPMQDLFQRRIGTAIGLNPGHWDWEHYETSDGLTVDGGGAAVNISAKDAARLGHLFLNHGDWDGEQLISSDWVDSATSVQVPTSLPEHPNSFVLDGAGMYGFGWWVNGVRANGMRRYPGAPPGTYAALGARQNNIFVIPEWDIVIAREGTRPPNAPSGTCNGFLSLLGFAVGQPPRRMAVEPFLNYMIFDDDADDHGDWSFEVSAFPNAYVGEFESTNSGRITRLVTKFQLPGGPNTARILEVAELRIFLHDVEGVPAGPVSLFHSVLDNDDERLASDYEDASYVDTLLDLVQTTDPSQAYYALDVTDLVLADYASDGGSPLSAFRLQVDGASFFDDDQSNYYRFTMPGANDNRPQLLLTFIPEPTAAALVGVGLICLLAWQRKSREHFSI